jgi:transposase
MEQKKSPPKYTAEFRERGVRLFQENRSNYSSDNAAFKAIAPKLGCSPDSLRIWCQQSERDAGARSGLSSADKDRLKALERENKELRTVNEILKKASAYFAPPLAHVNMRCWAAGRSSTARSADDRFY